MSDEQFYQVIREGRGEYEEKKSRFIAVVAPVKDEEGAAAFIFSKKKEHHDARHNCSAYVVTGPDGRLITRFSDDGEPARTAGQPILDVLQHAGLVNVVCVVTRYFGNILLGTGGLVRAYTESTKAAVEDAEKVLRRRGFKLVVATGYGNLGKVEYLMRDSGITVVGTDYGENVRITCEVPSAQRGAIEARVIEQTAGAATLDWGEEEYIG